MSVSSLKIVIKVGSSSITGKEGLISLASLAGIVETICALRRQGHQVVLVSSGAVSVGCLRLRMEKRPTSLVTKQAVAAVGQGRLMRLYDDLFSQLEQPIAQVLLSRENVTKSYHYNNALNTFEALLKLGVVSDPIVALGDQQGLDFLGRKCVQGVS